MKTMENLKQFCEKTDINFEVATDLVNYAKRHGHTEINDQVVKDWLKIGIGFSLFFQNNKDQVIRDTKTFLNP